MRINAAKKTIIERVLRRQKRREHSPEEVDLKDMLKGILRRANEFVPSESGSILLDDPVLDENLRKPGRLYFVACFGKGSKVIAGTSMPVSTGIAGRTYTTGKAYLSRNVSCDPNFCGSIDHLTGYRTKSLICVPVEIRGTTIGVIELINRAGKKNYDGKDLTLLKIFAHYTSTLIQNSLDAKRFGELSIRDNLTGIYNDRYFFDRLSKEVRLAVLKRGDLSLIFLDLDRFKEVNDTHGHLAGSQLLREVGAIVRSLVGQDVVPVRYGGDEFTLILT
ncbi:MAG: sensor domain-containing diguanylate cyclase [Deltaproteobacteria bacterium]|nr:sensor domain-containing diguanylate cyclase [Deltaproteobacteria bacterium]